MLEILLSPALLVRKRASLRIALGKSQTGFTLVELLVVLALAGLLMSLIPPLLERGASSAEMKGAARRVVAGLKYARSQAITGHKEAVLTLDLERHQFMVTGKKHQYPLPSNMEIGLMTASSQVDSKTIGKIRFFPDGTSTGGQITLSRGDRKYLIDINWLTGRVAILDEE
ncbi:general secretion pathway protein H [Candidatus Nitrosoglobus terrae]|uniref:Type II secretion system protein H n=1 Tax=Candidatus Nitrosoglobus terrae TaxID=1630141 RepID=A0A1Q2SKQ9_9GAMM|nr:GspH/FimT family protein [Candidatus Nitrosoglobus terrae]BAW79699.1 general secretion pathway protein H [Candidatus Nitrosoglobus terrae]